MLCGLLVPKWWEGRGLGKDPEKELSEKHKETSRESAENVATGGFLSSVLGKKLQLFTFIPMWTDMLVHKNFAIASSWEPSTRNKQSWVGYGIDTCILLPANLTKSQKGVNKPEHQTLPGT